MVVKVNGSMRVYACTLVDDDPAYDQGRLSQRQSRPARHAATSSLLQLFKYGRVVQRDPGH